MGSHLKMKKKTGTRAIAQCKEGGVQFLVLGKKKEGREEEREGGREEGREGGSDG